MMTLEQILQHENPDEFALDSLAAVQHYASCQFQHGGGLESKPLPTIDFFLSVNLLHRTLVS